MSNKDAFLDCIRKQQDCEFQLRFLIRKEVDIWKNIFTMLKLVKKGSVMPVNYDYGECILAEVLLELQSGMGLISNIFADSDDDRRIPLNENCELVLTRPSFVFLPSKSRHGFLREEWPAYIASASVKDPQKPSNSPYQFLGIGMPYYPDTSEAVLHFFELSQEFFNSFGSVYVLGIDYRARIETLRLTYSKVELELYCGEIPYSELLVKIFAKSGSNEPSIHEIQPQTDKVIVDIGFQPDTLSIVLLSTKDHLKIDQKELVKWRYDEEEGILIERHEEEIVSLSKSGESQNLEYKQEVSSDDNKNDLVESVVAFLNSNRGIILIGVSDKGIIIGTQRSTDDISKIIHDSIDPPPKNIDIEEKQLEGKGVIVVEVPQGEDAPYQSRRDKNWYVRHNANDMRMERSELLSILERLQQSRTSFSPRT